MSSGYWLLFMAILLATSHWLLYVAIKRLLATGDSSGDSAGYSIKAILPTIGKKKGRVISNPDNKIWLKENKDKFV